jgi:hypothetical protein
MAAGRKWNDLSERTRTLIITVAVAEGILKGGSHRHQTSASKSDPGPEVGVGTRASSGQTSSGSCRSHASYSGGGSRGREKGDLILGAPRPVPTVELSSCQRWERRKYQAGV